MRRHVRPISLFLLALAALAAPARASSTWVSIGPDHGGNMTALVASPSAPAVLYAGTANGGVQISRDGGQTWHPGGVLPDPGVYSLAVDPRQPNTVFAPTVLGLARSRDGGRSWARCSLEPPAAFVAVHPRNSAILFAGGEGGLFRSLDGCATWQKLTGLRAGLQIYSLAIDPFTPTRIYVSAVSSDGIFDGFYLSTDGGLTWARRASLIGSLLADPGVSQLLYMATDDGLFRSTNGGNTWRKALTLPLYPRRIAAVPGAPPQVCVIAREYLVYCSRDQGRSFQKLARQPDGLVDVLAGGGQGSIVAGGTVGGGVQRTPGPNARWVPSNRGFVTSRIEALAAGPGYLLAGGYDGLWRSGDGGASWSMRRPADQTATQIHWVHDVAVDPVDARTAYVAANLNGDGPGFWKSTDGGLTWSSREVDPGIGDMTSLAIDPGSPRTLYLADQYVGGIWKSTDGGDSWRLLPRPTQNVAWKLVVSPADSAVFAATAHGVERSRDGGETWQLIRAVANGDHLPLALAPSDPRFLYTRGFASRDGGDTWEATPPNPVADAAVELTVDPRDPETVYAATGDGVWRRVGAGGWERFGSGLVQPLTQGLAFDPRRPERLLSGTAGSGAYELLLER